MADKYQWTIAGNGDFVVEIPSGPSAGSYRRSHLSIEDGLIFIGHLDDGGFRPLKLRAADMPKLVAEIERRLEALRIKAQTRYEAEAAEREIERKMRAAGFESAGNAGDLWNRLNPVHRENF